MWNRTDPTGRRKTIKYRPAEGSRLAAMCTSAPCVDEGATAAVVASQLSSGPVLGASLRQQTLTWHTSSGQTGITSAVGMRAAPPAKVSIGDVYRGGGKQYRWDGHEWVRQSRWSDHGYPAYDDLLYNDLSTSMIRDPWGFRSDG